MSNRVSPEPLAIAESGNIEHFNREQQQQHHHQQHQQEEQQQHQQQHQQEEQQQQEQEQQQQDEQGYEPSIPADWTPSQGWERVGEEEEGAKGGEEQGFEVDGGVEEEEREGEEGERYAAPAWTQSPPSGRLPPLQAQYNPPSQGGTELPQIGTQRGPPLPSPSQTEPQIQAEPRGAVELSSRRVSNMAGRKDEDVIGANDSQDENGCCAIILTILSYMLVVLFFPVSLCVTIKVVQEYERAVIFRLGRLLPGGAKGPGIFFVMPCIEEYTKVDLRTVSFDVPPQEVLTRDSVTVSVDAVVYYRISNPTVSVANVENAANSTQLLAQTTLRNVLGTQNLAEILSNREHISEQMQNVLDDATDKWGIKVERVEIKDVRLPTQLQRAMAAEAEAARDARAKVIAAEGEQKASMALKEAADIMIGSPAALQLRYLQTLNSISAEKNSTIIFPLPIEMISGLIKK